MNTGEREIVCKKEGQEKGRARGSVHWGCYYAPALLWDTGEEEEEEEDSKVACTAEVHEVHTCI